MISWKVLYKLRTRESAQLKTVLELHNMEIHQKISTSKNQKVENHGEEEKRSRYFDHEILPPETRGLKQVQWLRVAGDKVVLKEDKEFAISGKQKDSVREETNAVSGTTVMSVQKPTPKTAPSSEPPTQRV